MTGPTLGSQGPLETEPPKMTRQWPGCQITFMVKVCQNDGYIRWSHPLFNWKQRIPPPFRLYEAVKLERIKVITRGLRWSLSLGIRQYWHCSKGSLSSSTLICFQASNASCFWEYAVPVTFYVDAMMIRWDVKWWSISGIRDTPVNCRLKGMDIHLKTCQLASDLLLRFTISSFAEMFKRRPNRNFWPGSQRDVSDFWFDYPSEKRPFSVEFQKT